MLALTTSNQTVHPPACCWCVGAVREQESAAKGVWQSQLHEIADSNLQAGQTYWVGRVAVAMPTLLVDLQWLRSGKGDVSCSSTCP